PDYEARLDGARRWAREWHFRVGVHLLRGITDAETAGRQYADLAEAVLAALWPVVIDNFAAKHGPPPGRGAVIVGMGSLGAGQLTATSDLDMLVIYDDQGQEASTGKRPLGTRPYFARLTQAMITAMTAPMSQGRLYEVDMRLRPSGNQGPVATSFASFDNDQRNEAWVWEHLALTRARVVAGPAPLAAEVTALIGDLLKGPRHRAEVLREVGEMRARIAGSKAPEGPWDAKIGAGRLQDIELFAQACALLEGTSAFRIPDVFAGPEARALAGEAGAAHLQEAYAACWRLQCAGRLLSSRPRARDALGQAGAQFLARQLDMGSIETAETRMIELYSDTARIIEDAIGPHAGRDEREKR
ncbi:MAG: glutamine-synthetase adenylyltransferase, partial [Sulfitobacter sp.]|nr:glutamine-synthetase adenylyltransferase [Sulfitobacter sp.]